MFVTATSGGRAGPISGLDRIGAEQIVLAFLVGTPVLWALGLLAPASAMLLAFLCLFRWPAGIRINLILGTWMLVSVAQGIAVFSRWSEEAGDWEELFRRLASLQVLGWLFIALALGAGYAYRLASKELARGVAAMGAWILGLGLVALVIWLVGGSNEASFRTPVSYILGPRERDFFFTAYLFRTEEFAGAAPPRLVLFFPWPTMLSIASAGIILVSAAVDRPWMRRLGIVGGLLGLALSFSRAGYVSVALAFACIWALRVPRFVLLGGIALAAFAGVGVLLGGGEVVQEAKEFAEAFGEARQGSSDARDLIYSYSWAAFLQSPFLGHGWVGESIHPIEDLPIGSHSSFYGTLYTGGVMTFGAFAIAMATTLVLLGQAALVGGGRERAALGIMIVLAVFAYGESLFSIGLPCLFLFLWCGGALAAARDIEYGTPDIALPRPVQR